jgi:hypothetical protein
MAPDPTDTLPARVRVPDDVIWQVVEEQVVLLSLPESRYYRLDPVGSRMWQVLDEHGDTAQAFRVLHDEYEVDEERLREDLRAFVARLADAGLLERKG